MREFPSSHEILKVFEKNPRRTFRLRELVVELSLRSSHARELKRSLRELARRRKIVYMKKNHFALFSGDRHAASESPTRSRGVAVTRGESDQRGLVTGRLIGHRDGYGFVVPDKPVNEAGQDVFIPAVGMSSAMHGDRVEVHVVRSKADGRLEGRIVRVTERAQRTVVGEFHCGARHNYVLPYDHRIPFEIVIPRGQEWPAPEASGARNRQFGGESEGRHGKSAAVARRSAQDLENLIVDVELTNFPGPAALPRGRVIEVLGPRDEFGVDVEIMIRKYHLPHRFPAEVLADASAQPQYISEAEREGRRDFRSLPIVTIDGETAKDFDDAVYVERLLDRNYILQVHIADVAHYVRPGTPLDRDARLRGTSVYFPDRAVPMLPLELSNGICSLNPHVDRLTMSALMEIDPEGRVVAYELLPGIIRSAERMTYTAVHAVLSGDSVASGRHRDLVEQFKLMEELALILNRRRDHRGSIDFDLPEPLIEFDEHGRMIGITRSERNIAHRIIEEFMLVANETVATYLEGKGAESLYRIHEKPDPKKVLEFEEIAAKFGYSLGIEMPAMRRVRFPRRDSAMRGERFSRFQDFADVKELAITSRHYQRLTQRIEGKPEERILSFLMLRSLKQARYSEENVGHFALAAPTYTHFTSPIRRYPDLIVHRILKAVLEAEGGSARVSEEMGKGRGGRRASQASRQTPARQTNEPNLPGGALLRAQELHNLGLETSEAERRAADAERELMEWKKVLFMAGRLGDEFDALIISLTKHGFFVELEDLFVEGFVPVESFDDDRYIYRERLRALVGRSSGKAYHLGEQLRVRLDRIDRTGNKLQFSVVG
ncbi:MAG TPA: RNB domain-containing ribonuclease [Terriglobia bacterium]|nr:RNB domain-containing ribonuclease [Terriglobia bacterium]